MQLLRLFLYVFGGLFLLSLLALARQLVREHLSEPVRRSALRGSVEGWLLFVAALVVAVLYLKNLIGARGLLPGIENEWLITYGACCAVYLGVKFVRMSRIHS